MKFIKFILVPAVLIAISVIIILPSYVSSPPRLTKHVQTCNEIKSLHDQLKLFKWEHKIYPTNEEGFEPLLSRFLSKTPIDPWGTPYIYSKLSEDTIEIKSYGSDGIVGGKGDSNDISLLGSSSDIISNKKCTK